MAHVRPPDPRDPESRSGQNRIKIEQPTTNPTRKVGAGALAGALTIIGVYIAEALGLGVPAEVASSITVVLTFATSYVVKDRA